jgi:CubicO group peptidase (beta-lactamase class C family)
VEVLLFRLEAREPVKSTGARPGSFQTAEASSAASTRLRSRNGSPADGSNATNSVARPSKVCDAVSASPTAAELRLKVGHMKRMVGTLAVCCCTTTAVVVVGQREADTSRNPSTVWLASPDQAARLSRTESQIPAVEIDGEPPIALTIQQWMDIFKIPGLSVAVFDRNEMVWAKTYGVKQAGGSDPVTLDTRFQAASISKPVTAMAALHFVEAGKWTLDEDINESLLSWKVPDSEFTKVQKVTLRRLLSHTAGTTIHGFAGYEVNQPMPTILQVLDGKAPANSGPVRVDLVPGTKERYSGGGTTIVQLMMVDQLKKPFPQIMMETVLAPLGLQHSTYEQPLPPSRVPMAATGTYENGTSVRGGWYVHPEMAAAGLWTTASDLARIGLEVAKAYAGMSTRVLSQAMTKQMLTEQMPRVGLGYGLGPGKSQFRHNGANQGFRANLIAFADTGSGIVVMTNSDSGSMIFNPIAASVAKEYNWTSFIAPAQSPSAIVGLLVRTRGAERALAWYKAARVAGPAEAFGPRVLNEAGYSLLRAGRTMDAVKVFDTNVALHPTDANAYDSLGEGQMAAGLKEAAIASYRKSLQMNPKNHNAIEMLQKLGVPTAPAVKRQP